MFDKLEKKLKILKDKDIKIAYQLYDYDNGGGSALFLAIVNFNGHISPYGQYYINF